MGKGKRIRQAKKIAKKAVGRKKPQIVVHLELPLSDAENMKRGLARSPMPVSLALPLLDKIQKAIMKATGTAAPPKKPS